MRMTSLSLHQYHRGWCFAIWLFLYDTHGKHVSIYTTISKLSLSLYICFIYLSLEDVDDPQNVDSNSQLSYWLSLIGIQKSDWK